MKMMWIITIAAILVTSCSKSGSIVEQNVEGSVTLAVSTPEGSKTRATKATKLRARIVNSAGTVLMDTAIALTGETSVLNIAKLDLGTNYNATVWTVDDQGSVIHSQQSKQFAITTNIQATLIFSLRPSCGSIYFELVEVPSTTDSVHLIFVSDSGKYSTVKGQAKKLALSLDRVAYGAHGKLQLFMLDKNRDTVSSWDTTFTYTNQNISGQFSFLKTGGISTQIIMTDPTNTIFTGSGDHTKKLDSEAGNLIITEFMASGGSTASSGEFIEIYNPKAVAFTADTLTLSAGDKSYKLPNLSIPAGGFYIVAAQIGTFWGADTVVAGLDLIGTSGILSISNNGIMQDYVIYFNDATMDWTSISGTKKSSELRSDRISADMNNLGSSWKQCATSRIDTEKNVWYGSPRVL